MKSAVDVEEISKAAREIPYAQVDAKMYVQLCQYYLFLFLHINVKRFFYFMPQRSASLQKLNLSFQAEYASQPFIGVFI